MVVQSILCSHPLLQPDAEPLETTFELNDTLYAKALVPPTEEVYLWLGANVMLAYPIAEAETLLESKLSAAQQNLENCEEDLDFLREQITVSPRISRDRWSIALIRLADAGSSSSAGLQLGRHAEEEREGGAGRRRTRKGQ